MKLSQDSSNTIKYPIAFTKKCIFAITSNKTARLNEGWLDSIQVVISNPGTNRYQSVPIFAIGF